METVTAEELNRAREIGLDWSRSSVVADLPSWPDLECDPRAFRDAGNAAVPTLHLEDVSAIPFVNVIAGVELYQHRARVRSYTGDVFAAVTPVVDGYED